MKSLMKTSNYNILKLENATVNPSIDPKFEGASNEESYTLIYDIYVTLWNGSKHPQATLTVGVLT